MAVTFKNYYLFLAALVLRCCVWASSNCGEQGLLRYCSGALPSHCSGFSYCWAWALEQTGSAVVAHTRSCSATCGIVPDQGLNSCLLYWQTDSLLQSHLGSPITLLGTGPSQQVLFIYSSMYSKEHQLHWLFLGFELEKNNEII